MSGRVPAGISMDPGTPGLIQNTAMLRITPMKTTDLPEVMAIERASQPEPWSERAFLEELNLPHSQVLLARTVEDVEQGGETDGAPRASGPHFSSALRSRGVGAAQPAAPREHHGAETTVGYVCFWRVADEVQILNLAVHPWYRGLGIGRALLLHALMVARRDGAVRAVLEVREGNLEAKRLYERVGFEKMGERPNYYDVIKETALLMVLQLEESWVRVHDPEALTDDPAI